MESERFDDLTRLIANLSSRRAVLRGTAAGGSALGLGGVGILPGFLDDAEAKKGKKKRKRRRRKKRKQKKRRKKCQRKCSSNDPCESASCNKKGKCKKRSTDNAGQACEAGNECCSGVCNCGDPDGWITQPDADTCQSSDYSQDFESNLDFWYSFQNDPPSSGNATFPPKNSVIERVASGANGIDAKSGGFYAQIKGADAYEGDLTPLSTLGGFSPLFPNGGIQTSIDVFLDPPNTADDQFVAYTVALNQTDCNHDQDFIFYAGKTAGEYCVGTGTGVNSNTNPCANGNDPDKSITVAGWFTFRHDFQKNGNDVVCTLTLLNENGGTVKNWSIPLNPGSEVGGNRYAWFPVNKFNFVAIDNSTRKS